MVGEVVESRLRNSQRLAGKSEEEIRIKMRLINFDELLESVSIRDIDASYLSELYTLLITVRENPRLTEWFCSYHWKSEFLKDYADALKASALNPLKAICLLFKFVSVSVNKDEAEIAGVKIVHWVKYSQRQPFIAKIKKKKNKNSKSESVSVKKIGNKYYVRKQESPFLPNQESIFSRSVDDVDLPPEVRCHAYLTEEGIRIELNNFVV